MGRDVTDAFRATIQKAAAQVKGRFVLTGTAGLWLRGYDVDPGDIDFLCESTAEVRADVRDAEPGSTDRSYRTTIDHVKVDYIFADEKRRPFLTENPDLVYGVPVASVSDLLAIKVFAGREKDRDFLVAWHKGLIKRRAA